MFKKRIFLYSSVYAFVVGSIISPYLQASNELTKYNIITTYAGSLSGISGDATGHALLSARFLNPYTLAIKSDDAVVIADSNNEMVKQVSLGGIVSLTAGTGGTGYSGDGSSALLAQVNYPVGICVKHDDDEVYLCQYSNYVVRKIDSSGIITRIAGQNGLLGTSDNADALFGRLNQPNGLFVRGDQLYIADRGSHKVRTVDLSSAPMPLSTLSGSAGSGYLDGSLATARFNSVNSIYASTDGNFIYVVDRGNNRIRLINIGANTVTTLVGTGTAGSTGDGGLATAARLNSPVGVVVDEANNVYYICEGSGKRVRKVDSLGIITTLAGTGSDGITGDQQQSYKARFKYPYTPALDSQGNLYIADGSAHNVRKIHAKRIIIDEAATVTLTGDSAYTELDSTHASGNIANGGYELTFGENLGTYVQWTTGGGTPVTESYDKTSTFAGVLSGSGGLTVNAFTGVSLTLSGANTYSGGTTVDSGTLVLNHATALPANTALVMNGGILEGGAYALALTSLRGTGGTINGTGTITLTQTGDTSFAGVIAGVGRGFTKAGAGALTLSGANTYSGGTTVSAGTMVVANGGSVGSVAVSPGSTLKVVGTAGTVTLGGATSTLEIGDGASFANTTVNGVSGTGIILFNLSATGPPVNGTTHSHVTVTSAVDFTNMILQVASQGGGTFTTGAVYELMTLPAGGSNENMATLNHNLVGDYTPTLSIVGGKLRLTLASNITTVTLPVISSNSTQTTSLLANINRIPQVSGSDFVNVLQTLANEGSSATTAFVKSSAPRTNNIARIEVDTNKIVNLSIQGRINTMTKMPQTGSQATEANLRGVTSNLKHTLQLWSHTPKQISDLSYDEGVSPSLQALQKSSENALAPQQTFGKWGGWINPIHMRSAYRDPDSDETLKSRSYGTIIGGDYHMETSAPKPTHASKSDAPAKRSDFALIGLSGGYTRTTIHNDTDTLNAKTCNHSLAVYGARHWGINSLVQLQVEANVTATRMRTTQHRTVVIPGNNRIANSHYTSYAIKPLLRMGLDFKATPFFNITPYVELSWHHQKDSRYVEEGAHDMNQFIAGRTGSVKEIESGLLVNHRIDFKSGTQMSWGGGLSYQQQQMNGINVSTVGFQAGGDPLAVTGQDRKKAINIIAHAAITNRSGFYLHMTYTGTHDLPQQHNHSHAFSLKLGKSF